MGESGTKMSGLKVGDRVSFKVEIGRGGKKEAKHVRASKVGKRKVFKLQSRNTFPSRSRTASHSRSRHSRSRHSNRRTVSRPRTRTVQFRSRSRSETRQTKKHHSARFIQHSYVS